jgi:L-rhamnose mutarotase
VKVGLRTKLKAGEVDRYEKYHAAVWPEVLSVIRRAGITLYVIFRDDLDLFHYIECDDFDRALAELAFDPVNIRWQAEMAPMMDSSNSRSQLTVIFDLR